MTDLPTNFFQDMTLEEWLHAVQDQLGLGFSENEDFPLSTYVPVNQQQLNIIKNYYQISRETLFSYTDFHELLARLQIDLDRVDTQYFFTDRYPTFYFFQQSVYNASKFIGPNGELYPGITYYPNSEFQEEMIKQEYRKQKQINSLYYESDLTDFANKLALETDIPIEYLPEIKNDLSFYQSM